MRDMFEKDSIWSHTYEFKKINSCCANDKAKHRTAIKFKRCSFGGQLETDE